MSAVDTTAVPPAVRYGRWVAFAAAAALTASGEFELAQLAGWPPYVAWLLPVALDVYAFCAFAAHSRADTMAALALMIACNVAYHLAATHLIPSGWQLVVMVAALPPVICWRVHRLGEQPAGQQRPRPAEVPPAPPAEVPAAAAAEVPPAELPAPPAPRAIPAERNTRPEVTAKATGTRRNRRPPAETRRLAAEIRTELPDISQQQLAARLGISDRQLRNVMAAA